MKPWVIQALTPEEVTVEAKPLFALARPIELTRGTISDSLGVPIIFAAFTSPLFD
jgi:hypothetical protein